MELLGDKEIVVVCVGVGVAGLLWSAIEVRHRTYF